MPDDSAIERRREVSKAKKEALGDQMCSMGDVPPTLFKLGTTGQVEEYGKKLIDVVGIDGGFILNSGCVAPDDTKFENVKAVVNTAKPLGHYFIVNDEAVAYFVDTSVVNIQVSLDPLKGGRGHIS